MNNLALKILASLALCAHASGQLPSISPGGIVNAASYASAGPVYHALATGSLASIFGTNLAIGTQSATATPLPTSLGGTTVTVNGLAAHLIYVSPTQINFQIPGALISSPLVFVQTPVIVTTAAGSSLPVSFDLGPYGPGLLTANGTGCGPAAAQNVSASGQVTLNSSANSVQPGEFMTVYGTGYGGSYPPLGDGVAAPASPLYSLAIVTGPLFDGVSQNISSFGGFAPGLVGVDQMNFQVPDAARDGCTVPLTIPGSIYPSQPVTVAVHRGGGACVDPPPAAEGIVTLKRVTTVGTANDGTLETLDATFTQSPGRKPTLIDPLDGPDNRYYLTLNAPSCPIPGYQQLSAGMLSLQTPFSSISGIVPAANGSYHVSLPPNTLQPGNFTISAGALGAAGTFQAGIPFGQDIQIQTPPPAPGSTFRTSGRITLSWVGGDPGSLVTVTLMSHFQSETYRSSCSALASVGNCTLPYTTLMGVTNTNSVATEHGELLYQIDPNPLVTPFSAPGLSLGGQATWRIQHSFQGFAIAF